MKSFISEVVDYLIAQNTDLEKTSFVFPSKRAGRFMLHYLSEVSEKTIFSPEIYSIEAFVEEVSGLCTLDNMGSIFNLYETYRDLTPKADQEEFETFYQWAQTLLYDFNEIDRYLISAESFFGYLSDIQDLKHWSQQDKKTPLVENYLKFWRRLPDYYTAFNQKSIANKCGHQGLQYRLAAEKIGDYLAHSKKDFVFAGFNALNTAEQSIIQAALESGKGAVFWDTDHSFFDDAQHGASLFLREYKKTWPFYQKKEKPFHWVAENYQKPKDIEIIGVPKNVGQAKYVGDILSKIPASKLKNTALVLGDERLAMPVLNSLPKNVDALNITMGLPLSQTPLASLFDLLLKTHRTKPTAFYYKDVIEIINHPAMRSVLGKTPEIILQKITQNNLSFLTLHDITAIVPGENDALLAQCFGDYKDDPLLFIQSLSKLTHILKEKEASLKNETLFHFNNLFSQLHELLGEDSPVKNISTLYQIYKTHIQSENLDFSGAPFSGLQMMGMLETRSLDFDIVILTSVNEGVLPAGKSTNSFIPYDLKREKGLPTYREKDAVYAYHFYRLLQRAKKVYLLYNAVPSNLNSGEKSRFITQLKIEKQAAHNIKEYTVSPRVPRVKNELKTIAKTPEIIEKLKSLAAYGFSPSALLTYVRNPLDFYKRYVLGVKETDEVEETIAANTLGTIIHNTLEILYTSSSGKAYVLTEVMIKQMLQSYEAELHKQFIDHYKHPEALKTGKNRITYEVAKRYILRFLKIEMAHVQQNDIQIIALEKELKRDIEISGLNFPICLKGSADRIDRFNGQQRIIDYKTGKVEQNNVEISNWEDITADYKHAKAFQVLTYAYMNHAESLENGCEAGIISFKNLSGGFLKFGSKTHSRDKNKAQIITAETMAAFESQLKKLIVEIFDPNIPFIEKEVYG